MWPDQVCANSFETREICDEIIAKFHGTSMGKEKLPLQVRYADTTGQKMLKTDATNRRQYKAAEYDVGVREVNGYYPSPTQLVDQLAPHLASTPTHGSAAAWSTGSLRSARYVDSCVSRGPLNSLLVK